jgi:CheY-like chemotaxis protein
MAYAPATAPHVLVVDDEASIRDVLVGLLDDEGYTTMAVAHGQAALDYLHAHPPPCCILLDLYMPVLDGWQFHHAQLRTPQLARIPVIVMSAVAQALQPLAWFQAAGYLCKPFTVDEVLALVVPLCPPPRLRS